MRRAIQGLPVCLHSRQGSAEEFLPLPFGLRKRAASDPVLALQDPPRGSRMAASITSGDEERRRPDSRVSCTHRPAAFCLAATAPRTPGG